MVPLTCRQHGQHTTRLARRQKFNSIVRSGVPPDVLQNGAAVRVDALRHISSRSHHAGNTQCLAVHGPNSCPCITCTSSHENASAPREAHLGSPLCNSRTHTSSPASLLSIAFPSPRAPAHRVDMCARQCRHVMHIGGSGGDAAHLRARRITRPPLEIQAGLELEASASAAPVKVPVASLQRAPVGTLLRAGKLLSNTQNARNRRFVQN